MCPKTMPFYVDRLFGFVLGGYLFGGRRVRVADHPCVRRFGGGYGVVVFPSLAPGLGHEGEERQQQARYEQDMFVSFHLKPFLLYGSSHTARRTGFRKSDRPGTRTGTAG